MGIDIGLETRSDYEEELRIEDIGGRVMVYRPPTTGQIAAMSLQLSGRRKDEGAARDFLEAVILSKAEIEERAYGPGAEGDDREVLDEELAEALNRGVADMDLLIERLADPEYSFDQENLNTLVRYIMEQRAGFPTKPSSASSPGRTTTGRTSTAASRRVGSTRSGTSRRTAS